MGCGSAQFSYCLSSHLLAVAEARTVGGGGKSLDVSGRMLTMAGLFDVWRRRPNVSDVCWNACLNTNTTICMVQKHLLGSEWSCSLAFPGSSFSLLAVKA